MAHKHFDKLKVTNLPKGEAEIAGEIPLAFLVELRAEALKSLNKNLNLPGFRPGNIPEDILVKKVGEMSVLEECAELALGREYSHIIEESKLAVIGRPNISITKLAPGIPLEFKIKVTVEPDFKLPDYKKISKEAEKVDAQKVEDKEVEDVVKELNERKIDTGLKEGEKLEDKVRENLELEKKQRAQEMRRLKIMEKLVSETKVEVPDLLVNAELEKMVAQFRDDIARHGLNWDEYLKEGKKTEEDLRNDWREKAQERVKAELIVGKIAQTEKLEPDEKAVSHEAKHLLEHFPDADPLRASVYVYGMLRTQKVLEFLENL